MNKNVKKIYMILIIFGMVGVMSMVTNAAIENLPVLNPELKSNKSDMFIEVCCVANDIGTWGGVLKLPVKVTVMNNNLFPISGASVTMRISGYAGKTGLVTIDGVPDYEYGGYTYGGVTKKTNPAGIVKFKVKMIADAGIQNENDYKLEVIVTKGSQKEVYGQFFRVMGDF